MVISERRSYLIGGIYIGAGVVMIILGIDGWIANSDLLATLNPVLKGTNYSTILSFLDALSTVFLFVAIGGLVFLIYGIVWLARREGWFTSKP